MIALVLVPALQKTAPVEGRNLGTITEWNIGENIAGRR